MHNLLQNNAYYADYQLLVYESEDPGYIEDMFCFHSIMYVVHFLV